MAIYPHSFSPFSAVCAAVWPTFQSVKHHQFLPTRDAAITLYVRVDGCCYYPVIHLLLSKNYSKKFKGINIFISSISPSIIHLLFTLVHLCAKTFICLLVLLNKALLCELLLKGETKMKRLYYELLLPEQLISTFSREVANSKYTHSLTADPD